MGDSHTFSAVTALMLKTLYVKKYNKEKIT